MSADQQDKPTESSGVDRERKYREALEEVIADIESEPVCCGIPHQFMGRHGPEQECCGSPEYGWERAIRTAKAALSIGHEE